MKWIFSTCAMFLLIFLLPQIARSQGVCVGDQRTLPMPKGIVIEPIGIPIPKTVIELHENEFMGPIVSQTTTDVSGRFELTNIKPGKYVLVATAEAFFPMSIPLKVTGKKLSKNRRVELIITLGASPNDPCNGGKFELSLCEFK